MSQVNEKTKKIARLNDWLRRSFNPVAGRVTTSQGINALPKKEQFQILKLVQAFNNFSKHNDTYGEHDCASFKHNGKNVIWKIDYYNKEYSGGSAYPEDSKRTNRVLTIMLGHEY